jgi:hypothetical protein
MGEALRVVRGWSRGLTLPWRGRVGEANTVRRAGVG